PAENTRKMPSAGVRPRGRCGIFVQACSRAGHVAKVTVMPRPHYTSKWEYKVDRSISIDRVEQHLNTRGHEGWELVHAEFFSAVSSMTHIATWTLFLKRQAD